MNDAAPEISRTAGGGRVIWIDIMRGIAILLIVLCHLSMYGSFPYSLYKLFYVFHVPIFFFVTGCVEHFDMPMGKFAMKKAKALLIPYFILFLASHPGIFKWSRWEKLPTVFFDLITGLNVGPLWFLPTLFFTELFFKFIYDRAAKTMFYWTVLLACIGIIVDRFVLPVHLFGRKFVDLFWHLDVVLIVLLFMYLGHGAFRKEILNKIMQKPAGFYGAVFLCLCVTVFSAKFNEPVDIHYGRYGFFPWFYLGACAGIFLTAFVSIFLERSKFGVLSKILVLAGKNSLVLLAFHWLFGEWFSDLLSQAEKHFHFAVNGYIRVYAVFFASILMTVPAAWIINRYLPFAVGRRKTAVNSMQS